MQTDPSMQQQSIAQMNNSTNSNNTFYSAKDLFVTSEPQGYGIYQERDSNVFQPGETIIIYIEPVGFKYNNLTDEKGRPVYSVNFSAGFTLSYENGTIVGGQENLPVSEITSYNKVKEVFIPFTITQSSPFPPGDYYIMVSITDQNSGNVFEINKNITISSESSLNPGPNNNNNNNVTSQPTTSTTEQEI
jgi:hypothetical protein